MNKIMFVTFPRSGHHAFVRALQVALNGFATDNHHGFIDGNSGETEKIWGDVGILLFGAGIMVTQ